MDNLKIKSNLLSLSKIKIDSSVLESTSMGDSGNLLRKKWIFIKLNKNSRVRMDISSESDYVLYKNDISGLVIFDTKNNKIIVDHVEIEEPIVHAPEQMFFTLYRSCIRGCKFCPLTYANENTHHSANYIIGKIDDNKIPKSIGITSSNPRHLVTSDIIDEMCFLTKKIRKKLGNNIPIGASMNSPSFDDIKRLKKAGINELRLNIEIPNEDLAKKIMPNKSINEIYNSINMACDIFGENKISSNIIIGLGETDSDISYGINKLASMGAIATLYPYDSINVNTKDVAKFSRPSSKRIYELALEHKHILSKYNLNPLELQTMCGSCAASHILPFKDF